MFCNPLWLSCHLMNVYRLWVKLWLWLWLWCCCGSRHVGTTLVPLDSVEAWALSDWPVCLIAFNPLLPKNVSDEKRERQTLSFCVLSYSMVHSFPEFVNLPLYDLGN